jgi:flavodoxin
MRACKAGHISGKPDSFVAVKFRMKRPATLLVYKSVHHQNTAQLARALGEVLQADLVSADQISPNVDGFGVSLSGYGGPSCLDRYDLIGFGSGVYYGRMHPDLLLAALAIASAVNHLKQRPPAAFLFSTSGLPFLAPLWHRPFKDMLTRAAIPVIGEFACRGFDSWGPLWLFGGLNRHHPDVRDLERGRRFAKQLLAGWENRQRCRAA